MERKARRTRRYIYPQNISVFYLIWLSTQRTGFIEFIINFSRTAILSRHIPLPTLFEVGTPFLPPVSRKSCANGCSAISARGRNQMNARWMPRGKSRGARRNGLWGNVLKDRQAGRDKSPLQHSRRTLPTILRNVSPFFPHLPCRSSAKRWQKLNRAGNHACAAEHRRCRC